jgi:hypothetical protein
MRATYTHGDCYAHTNCDGISDSHRQPNTIRATNDPFADAICNIYSYFNADYDAAANSHPQSDTDAAASSHSTPTPIAPIL